MQVLEDLRAIWEWILTAKLDIPSSQRTLYSAILVVPETFDNRGTSNLGLTLFSSISDIFLNVNILPFTIHYLCSVNI